MDHIDFAESDKTCAVIGSPMFGEGSFLHKIFHKKSINGTKKDSTASIISTKSNNSITITDSTNNYLSVAETDIRFQHRGSIVSLAQMPY